MVWSIVTVREGVLGSRLVQVGIEKCVFRVIFYLNKDEKLLLYFSLKRLINV